MATKKKQVPKQKEILVLTDGSRHEIINKDGKYYYCADTKIRISGSRVLHVEVETEKPAEKGGEEE